MDARVTAAAFHEVGHAVIARLLGLGLKKVRISLPEELGV